MPSAVQVVSPVEKPVRVLVVGGGYGGLAAGLNLLDLCAGKKPRFSQDKEVSAKPKIPIRIKFIDERDGYYHLIGSPYSLASSKYAERAWTKYSDLPALRNSNLSWAQGSVKSVDCEKKSAKIADGKSGLEYEESYDYLVAATGLRRTWPTVPQSLQREDYLAEAGKHINAVKNAKHGVAVIGGGAVGIEMASEIKLLYSDLKVTLLHSRAALLSSEPLPAEFTERSLKVLRETGVEVVLGSRVNSTTPVASDDGSPLFKLGLSDGTELLTGHVIMAISHQVPTTSYFPSDALSKEGYVKVNNLMNLTTVPNPLHHFAIGDIIDWSGIKRCGAAMAMGHNAAVNIHQQILHAQFGKEPKYIEFPEISPMIALAIGKKAVMFGPDGTSDGPEVLEMMFGNDLGLSICWNYLQLGIDGAESLGGIEEKDVEMIVTTVQKETVTV